PHLAAGSRTEPPPSLPWATGTRPAATAAAAPPLDPPVEREVSHGLRHGPQPADSVVATSAISEVLQRPASTNPAARIAWTKQVSWSARSPASMTPLMPAASTS